MMSSRWRKVFADLWINKTRTVLTILTVLVGVFAIGFLQGMSAIMIQDMDVDYQAANPHAAVLYTQPFDDVMVRATRRVPGVADAEGRGLLVTSVNVPPDRKVSIAIDSIVPAEIHLDRLRPADPSAPMALSDHEIWVEGGSLGLLPVKTGETVQVETPDKKLRTLRVSAIVRDVSEPASAFTGQVRAYVTPATLEWLGGTRVYNRLLFTVSEQRTDEKHVEMMAKTISDRFEKGGIEVQGTNIYNPGRHFSYEIFAGLTVIFQTLGFAIVFLSGFLVINTINVLVSQQVRQIAIMKAVGGQSYQILVMYLVLILSFGVLALLVAVPLGALAAYATSLGLSNFVNIRLQGFRVESAAVIAQVVTALGVPLVAGLVPVLNGVRVTVREAISDYGISGASRSTRPSLLYRIFSAIFSRPMLVSLQNTFRRRGRLAMMLTILTLGGAVFIAVFNLWKAFDTTLLELQGYFLADVNIYFSHPYRLEKLTDMISSVPGVASTEGWASTNAQVLSPDPSAAPTDIFFIAPPARSKLVKPVITAGRWLLPEDQNAVVIGNHLLAKRPELKVGDELIVKIKEKETSWRVVGIFRMVGNVNPPFIYTNREALAPLTGLNGLTTNLRVIADQNDLQSERRLSKNLQALFKREGVQVSQMELGVEWYDQQASTIVVMVYFLLVMALLITIVGGLGLMSTMSMNVLERTREIGIYRATGASNGAILRLILVEGMLIGALSWGLAALASLPLTVVLNSGVGMALFQAPVGFSFDWHGLLYWWIVILFMATLSSLLPALRAVRLTVRDVLAYE